VRLDDPGSIHYIYQYPDDDTIFEFQAQNEMCQSVASNDDTRWPPVTEEGKWHSKTIELPEGLNVLQWKAMGISGRQTKPLLIKLIQVRLCWLVSSVYLFILFVCLFVPDASVTFGISAGWSRPICIFCYGVMRRTPSDFQSITGNDGEIFKNPHRRIYHIFLCWTFAANSSITHCAH